MREEEENMLEKLFHLKENKTTVKTEVTAGITSFFTMAYIIFVNPQILSAAGMDAGAVMLATCVASAIGTFLMTFLANYPFDLAPGMGLNATPAFTICGFFSALGGLLLNTRVLMATSDAADGYELSVIAACIIGGISMDGGEGNILSTIVGTSIMGLILNMLQLLGISSFWTDAVTGAIIIGAVAIDSLSSKKRE